MRRRNFIRLLGGATAWPLVARTQQRDHSARVGILTPGGARENPLFAAFRQEMNRFGYVEGRNLVLEFRSAADDPKRLPELAAELQTHCSSRHGETIARHLPGAGFMRMPVG